MIPTNPHTLLPPMLILCGGLGTRLRTVLADRPKPMAEVAGKPFLEHLIAAHQAQGVSRFILAAGHLGEHIEAHFRHTPGIQVLIEASPRGTAGSVHFASQNVPDGDLLVCNGDSFCAVDLRQLHALRLARNALATIAVARVEQRSEYGTLAFSDDFQLLDFAEKRPDDQRWGWVNAGVYCFSRALRELLPEEGSLEREVFPALLNTGRLYVAPTESPLLDIGTPTRLAQAAAALKHIQVHQRELV